MELNKALEVLDKNKTETGYIIYNEEAAQELHRIASEALAEMKEGEELYDEIKANKDNFGELVEAFAAANAFNKGMHTKFPLMFGLSTLFHPEGGVIITPIEDGLKKVLDSGNWPESADDYETVAANCSICLQAIRVSMDKQIETDPLIRQMSKSFMVVVGNPESHPLIQQVNDALKESDRVTYMALGFPAGLGS